MDVAAFVISPNVVQRIFTEATLTNLLVAGIGRGLARLEHAAGVGVIALVLYLVFVRLLKVPMPRGIFDL